MVHINTSDANSSQAVEFLLTIPVISSQLDQFSQKKKKIMAILMDTVSNYSENFETQMSREWGPISSFQTLTYFQTQRQE